MKLLWDTSNERERSDWQTYIRCPFVIVWSPESGLRYGVESLYDTSTEQDTIPDKNAETRPRDNRVCRRLLFRLCPRGRWSEEGLESCLLTAWGVGPRFALGEPPAPSRNVNLMARNLQEEPKGHSCLFRTLLGSRSALRGSSSTFYEGAAQTEMNSNCSAGVLGSAYDASTSSGSCRSL